MQNEVQKISIKEKIGYGVGDTASNLFFQITIYFLLIFYTDVFGLNPKDAALMFLLTRVWDAINDPIMGALADRTRTRWGNFRPYLLWCAIPFGLIFVLMFTTPEFSYGGKVAYAYVTYTLMMMIYTVINVPYSALMGVITPSSSERTVVSAYRFVLAFIAMFIVQYTVPYMVREFGGGNDALGWQRAVMVLAGMATVLFLITFSTTKERVQVKNVQKGSMTVNIKDLSGNFPWLLIGGATVFQLMFVVMRGGNIAYYFKYFIKAQIFSLFGHVYDLSSDQLLTGYLLMGTFITILGAIMTKFISNILGKSRTYSIFMLLCALSCLLVCFLKPQQVVILFTLQIVTSFTIGPVSVLQWAIYTDTADYQEWKNCRRATAFIMAASLFALKLGVAFGGSLLAFVLDRYGYVANAVQQSEEALKGICMAMSVYPALIAVAAAFIMVFYPLNKERMELIEADLIERRKQGGEETDK